MDKKENTFEYMQEQLNFIEKWVENELGIKKLNLIEYKILNPITEYSHIFILIKTECGLSEIDTGITLEFVNAEIINAKNREKNKMDLIKLMDEEKTLISELIQSETDNDNVKIEAFDYLMELYKGGK